MAKPAVEIEGLVKRYGRTPAVDGVSLTVDEGTSFGYLGPNGAGKTTTLRCALGLIRPTAGVIRIFGLDVTRRLGDVLADVGYLPGEFGLWPSMTGGECLDYLGSLHRRPALDRRALCDRFTLAEADLHRQVREYSRGMRQKIGIVQAFQHAPPLVILDEPTEGLDPVMKEEFVSLLADHRAKGGTVFLSSHILSEVEEATDRVGVLKAGRLIKEGPTADLSGERVRHCTLLLKEPVRDIRLSRVPGVSDVVRVDSTIRFDFRGDMQPLLRAVARMPVREFLSEPERLSETFFEVFAEESA